MIRATLADAARRAVHVLARGTVKKINDTLKMRELDTEVLMDEVHQGVEHFEHYGFTAVPLSPTGAGKAEAIVAFLGGARSHPVVIATGDRRFRPKSRAEGEVTLHDDQGQEVYITRAGIQINGGSSNLPVTVTVGSSVVTITATEIDITSAGRAFISVAPGKQLYLGGDPDKGGTFSPVETVAGPSSWVQAKL